jgi:hypothetical protein
MRRMIVALGAAAVLVLPGASVAHASAALWTVLPTPYDGNSSDTDLVGISCPAASDCTALSSDGAALQWNGNTWAAIPAINDAHYVVLSGISCITATYCIAAGTTYPLDGGHQAAAWRWNGITWTAMTVDNTSSTENELLAVRCASAANCEAVGQHGDGNISYPLAEHWNGRTWTRQATPGAPPGSLAAVDCQKGAAGCEAVGTDDYDGDLLALTLTGSKWHQQSSTTLPVLGVTGLSCWASGCLAVGYGGQDPAEVAQSWRLNGSTWSAQSAWTPPVPQGDNYTAIWDAVHCQSARNCTAVGSWTDNTVNGAFSMPVITTWDGIAWTRQPVPDLAAESTLHGLACNNGSVCTAVGIYVSDDFGYPLALRN